MKLYIPNIFTTEKQMRDEIDSFFDNPHSDYYSSQEFEESGCTEEGYMPTSKDLEEDLSNLFRVRTVCTGSGIYVSEPKRKLRHISI